MKTKIDVYVELEYVGSFYMNKPYTEFIERIVKAVKNNPTIVDLTNLDDIPTLGMSYDGENFIAKKGLSFSKNSYHETQHVFGFVVNGMLVAIQHLEKMQMDAFIAAYQSDPIFKVSEIEDDEW